MTGDDLQYLGLVELGEHIHARRMSSVEAVQATLDRISRLDGALKSFSTVTAEAALADARVADRELAEGKRRSRLHGAPVAVKDLCWVKDTPTSHGMPLLRENRPAEDGTVVARLRAAGAVILGKLQQTEGALGLHHPDIEPPVNPWNPDLWTGVSSSGSGVATAAGLCYGSIGTDTGGSIRLPSACNGVTGLKPTWGRVSRHGAFELAATLDHIGPMARSAMDCGAMLGVIAGADPKDPTAAPEPVPDYLAGLRDDVRGMTIGVDSRLVSQGVDDETGAAFDEALRTLARLGAEIREIAFPDPTQAVDDWTPLCGIETAVAHADLYPAHKEAYGPGLASFIELGRNLSAMDYQRIVLRREAFRGQVRALFQDVDLIAMPTLGFAAPTLAKMAGLANDPSILLGALRFNCPFDMTGSPTITLPAGAAANGGCIGFQLVGRHFDEARLVNAGHAFQSHTDWHRRHPAP
ncbi:amidase [Camelimonas sp. ID_303_24]